MPHRDTIAKFVHLCHLRPRSRYDDFPCISSMIFRILLRLFIIGLQLHRFPQVTDCFLRPSFLRECQARLFGLS